MDRDKIRERFSPLLDGELSPEERAEVEAALSEDAELLRELDALKRVDQLYSDLPPMTAPEGFEEGVRSALRPATLQFTRARIMRQQLWPLLAAAAVFIVVGAVVVVQMNPQRSPMRLSKNLPDTSAEMAAESAAPQPSFAADEAAAPASSKPSAPESAAFSEENLLDTEAGPGPGARSSGRPGNGYFQKTEEMQDRSAGAALGSTREDKDSARSEVDSDLGRAATQGAPLEAQAPQRTRSERMAGQMAEPPPVAADDAQESQALGSLGYAEKEIPQTQPGTVGPPAEPPMQRQSLSASAREDAPENVARSQPSQKAKIESVTPAEHAGRLFHKKAEDWIQNGYDGEPLTTIRRDSDEWKQLLQKEGKLRDILKLDGRLVFKLDKTWYELLPLESPGS